MTSPTEKNIKPVVANRLSQSKKIASAVDYSLIGLVLAVFLGIVAAPLWSLFDYASRKGLGIFITDLQEPNAVAALTLTLKVAVLATLVNLVVGTALAFVLHRTAFPGKKAFDALVDIPLAIPAVVTGFALLILYGPNGSFGQFLSERQVHVMFSLPGIVLAHVFVTFPFMVRAVGGALEAVDPNLELASRTLGAGRIKTFFSITVPLMRSGMVSGGVLTFARSIGEFGASIMVSGNLVGQTQTGPLYIYSRFNTGDIEGAAAIAVFLAFVSFVILFGLKLITNKRAEAM